MADPAVLARLRARIAALERGADAGARGGLSLCPAIDAHLPADGLAWGGVHEISGADGSAWGFAALILARAAAERERPVLWCRRGRGPLPYPPGLAALGLAPDRLLLAWTGRDTAWAMEQALTCPDLAAVLAETDRLDLTPSRRLQRAAEATGVLGIALRPPAQDLGANAALTRWRVTAAPSTGPGPWVGVAAWDLDLWRCRGAPPGRWTVQWHDDGRLTTAPDRTDSPALERTG